MCLSWRDDSVLPVERVVEVIRVLGDFGFDEVILTGGECTLYPGIGAVLDAVRQARLRLGFITNGYTIAGPPEERPDLPYEGISQVIYSRDFPDPAEHATWRKLPVYPDSTILVTLRSVRESGTRVQVNTVLMPRNVEALPHFAGLPFWDNVDAWHLIPVKGPIAKTWKDEQLQGLQRLAAKEAGSLLGRALAMLTPGFLTADLADIRASRPTIATVAGERCLRQRSSIYLDASGHVLPCNSIDWTARHTVGFGNVRDVSVMEILDRRQRALGGEHNAVRVGCSACDPLNVRFNIDHRHP
jgi:MoaA/NifB/PqqE/SkfB family radical SAM enzyme